jgi:uncharacterized protein (DUF2147 family)
MKTLLFLGLFFIHDMTYAKGDNVLGYWWTPKKDGKVRIIKKDGKYKAHLVAVLKKFANDLDKKNPKKNLRNKKVLGMKLFWDFEYNENSARYLNGRIYDANNGKTYKCRMQIDKKGNLEVRGYIGISLFGRTEIFEKVRSENPLDDSKSGIDLVYDQNLIK